MSKCKTVTLRKRKIKNGTQYSLCLDYYPGYRDNTTMKVITREALGIYIFAKPANQQERDFNARMMKKAEILRNRRYEAIFNENNGFFDKAKMKGDFLAYFKGLADRKNIKWQHVYKHFERFVNGKCTFEEVDVDLCRKFMEYLLNGPTIHTHQPKAAYQFCGGLLVGFPCGTSHRLPGQEDKGEPKRLLRPHRVHSHHEGTSEPRGTDTACRNAL